MKKKLYWKKLWKDIPDKMQRANAYARKINLENYAEKLESLRTIVMTWPPVMTSHEVKDKLRLMYPTEDDPLMPSLFRHLKRNSLISFDAEQRKWVNMSHLHLGRGM